MEQQDVEAGRYETLRSRREEGHPGAIWCCCFAGKLLATGSVDETVKLWKVGDDFDLHEEARLAKNSLGVADVDAFGNHLVTSSMDSRLRLWDIEECRIITQIPPKEEGLRRAWMCAFSHDGNLVATGGRGGRVDLYSVETHARVMSLKTGTKFVSNLAPSPCGRYLACSSPTGCVTLFDMTAGKILRTFEDHPAVVRTLAFSPDSKVLATGSDDGTIKLYQNYSTVNPDEILPDVDTLAGHSGWVLSLDFSPDNEFVSSSSTDNTVRVWPLKGSDDQEELIPGPKEEKIHGDVHDAHVWGVKFDDTSLLVSVGADEAIALYE